MFLVLLISTSRFKTMTQKMLRKIQLQNVGCRKLTTGQSTENRYLRLLSHKWDIYIICPPHKAQGSLWNKGQKDCKNQRSEKIRQKQCLLDIPGTLSQ